MTPNLTYFTGDAPVLTPQELSLYGTLDRVRQMQNASVRAFVNEHREWLQERVLDYGAGKAGTCRIPQPFRSLIDAHDYNPWEPGDPDPSPKFNGILCTQACQNFEDPQEIFNRFNIWLRPGGALVLTYPVTWEPIEHELWRFTPRGIDLLCHRAGLDVVVNRTLSEVYLDGSLTLPLAGGLLAVRPKRHTSM
jgi:hypothetical protein